MLSIVVGSNHRRSIGIVHDVQTYLVHPVETCSTNWYKDGRRTVFLASWPQINEVISLSSSLFLVSSFYIITNYPTTTFLFTHLPTNNYLSFFYAHRNKKPGTSIGLRNDLAKSINLNFLLLENPQVLF